ncbi:MAG: aspartate aminotransferase family protein [Oscillospiraceae bacterium]|nr:aspartate aminotransferase family protein [Oscillospiraceae bacterium]
MNPKQLIERDRRALLQIYDTQDIVFTTAEGMYLIDGAGKRYLDFSAQFSACTLGHKNEEMIAAITAQMRKLVSVTSMFATEERVELAEKLVSIAPPGLEKVMFGCTGSDANELALKIAKYYRGGGKIFSFRRGFHGSTAGSAAVTGKSETIQANTSIAELLPRGFVHSSPPYCYRCDFDKQPETCNNFCLNYLEQTILHEGGDKIAAVLLEPVFAAGGVLVPPPGFMKKLRDICDRYGALLIYDEVVTGMGQCGKMWAAELTPEVTPDILVTGKGLTGGYVPGSAVLTRRDIGERIDDVTLHGHTHSCYPGMCAATLKNIEIIERDGLVERAATSGDYLHEKLLELKAKYPEVIGDVRGVGLLQGFELVCGAGSKEPNHKLGQLLFKDMLQNGLVTELESRSNMQNAVIVLHPPIIATKEDCAAAVEIMDQSFARCIPQV